MNYRSMTVKMTHKFQVERSKLLVRGSRTET
jgi:hypothetical protein